jgi:hypothetical protein
MGRLLLGLANDLRKKRRLGSLLNFPFATRVYWDNTETDPAVDKDTEMLNYFKQIKQVGLIF